MGMFSFFTKKDTEFYDLFLASAKYFNSSAKLINDVMSGNNKAEAKLSDMGLTFSKEHSKELLCII